jgi:hypothetical protein
VNHPASTTLHAAGILLTTFVLVGCSSWHSIGRGLPADYVAREKPSSVRVSLAESTLVLSRPVVRGDSVVGLAKEPKPARLVAVPAADIRKLEARSAKGSTAAKIIVGTFWAMGLAAMVALALYHGPAIK